MTKEERHQLYLTCKAWDEHKSWKNFKALWYTFEPWVNPFQRLYYIIRNTITKKYFRVCCLYESMLLRGDD